MAGPDLSPSSVYRYPRYYAIGYQWNTAAECDFLEACVSSFLGSPDPVSRPRRLKAARIQGKPTARTVCRILDIGCGAGRHLLELARRGHQVTGFDLRPEMVAFVQGEASTLKLAVAVSVGDLRDVTVEGTFDVAVCLMDTFRFLLTNDEIVGHLRQVAQRLVLGGLYVTDFWIPMQWPQIGSEVYQWEQTEGKTTVRVFYLQHPDSIDPVSQTFEDELVFEVEEDGATRAIRGERTKTRLILPQEFRALVDASGVFELVGTFGEFDLDKPLKPSAATWRMVSVLKKT